MDSKLKEKFLFFLGKLDALKDNIFNAIDDISIEEFENGEKEFNIIDFATADLFTLMMRLKGENDGDNYDNGFTAYEKMYFKEIYDAFSNFMPIKVNKATNMAEKEIKNQQERGKTPNDRFEIIIYSITNQTGWWALEETPPALFYMMNYDYEYSRNGKYLMQEYIDLLIDFANDFMEYNGNSYTKARTIFKNAQKEWMASINEFILEIEES